MPVAAPAATGNALDHMPFLSDRIMQYALVDTT
ncbi:MAG: hypothetical protein ACI8WM_000377 [Burkholderiaceae bacterium]